MYITYNCILFINFQKISNSESVQQPSLSDAPLQHLFAPSYTPSSAFVSTISKVKSQKETQSLSSSYNSYNKPTFKICEICYGYINNSEHICNHMEWKIDPKRFNNHPPLNCQKCEFKFFTDQYFDKHLLESHGLISPSMQYAANIGNDSGR